MKHQKMTKMVAWCSYSKTPRPPGASPLLSSLGQHGGAAVSKGQGPGPPGDTRDLYPLEQQASSLSPLKAKSSRRCRQKTS